MKIIVEDNSLQVAKNFEKQVKEQPQIVKTALGRTAEFLMGIIKQRTSKGIGTDGRSFPSYTEAYKTFRKNAGRQVERRDLNFSGQMLSNITQRSSPTEAIIYFANKFQNTKAYANQEILKNKNKGQKFFGIGEREIQPIMNVFMKEYNKLSKI